MIIIGKNNFKNMQLFAGERTENQILFFTHNFSVKLSKSLLILIWLLGKEGKEGDGDQIERDDDFSAW